MNDDLFKKGLEIRKIEVTDSGSTTRGEAAAMGNGPFVEKRVVEDPLDFVAKSPFPADDLAPREGFLFEAFVEGDQFFGARESAIADLRRHDLGKGRGVGGEIHDPGPFPAAGEEPHVLSIFRAECAGAEDAVAVRCEEHDIVLTSAEGGGMFGPRIQVGHAAWRHHRRRPPRYAWPRLRHGASRPRRSDGPGSPV